MRKFRLGFFALLLTNVFFISTAIAEVSISGVIEEQFIDYPNGTAVVEFNIVMNDQRTKLDLSQLSDSDKGSVRFGAFLVFSGNFNADGSFAPTAILAEAMGATDVEEISGTFKIAIMIVNLNDASTTCNFSDVESVMYTGAQNVKEHLEESSRGTASINPDGDGNLVTDIFGPYTLGAYSATSCDYNDWATAADAAATGDGVNLSDYDARMYILPRFNLLACGWAGLASVGCMGSGFFTCRSWIADCTDGPVYSHELGHNYGMRHASTDPDNDETINVEYGDYSCPMGNSNRWMNFNAPHQDQMGWLDSFGGAVSTTTALGTYTVTALEDDPSSATNPQIVRFPHPNSEYYYFSYRVNTGEYGDVSSTFEDKLSIHRYDGATSTNTRLIDTLDVGEMFFDTTLGISVEPLSKTANTMTFEIESISLSPDDNDNDGVTDVQELIDGTNPLDSGSYMMRLSSPVHTLWNGFLGMVNIAELVNPGGAGDTSVTIEVYRLDGSLGSTQTFTLTGGQQQDIILNSLGGFEADSYGVVRISYTGELDGRISYYRNAADGTYEFAYSVALANANVGETAVGFNTFQPSQNGNESGYQVYNWLSIVNLASTSKSFTVYTYDQTGALLATRPVTLNSFGRADIDGGHDLAGPNVVGLHRIVPDDLSAPYIGQTIRYGSNAPAGAVASSFYFAFPLSARPGNGEVQFLPLSHSFGEENWVEVSNVLSETVDVTVNFYGPSRSIIFSQTVTIPPYGQYNFSPTGSLDPGDIGYAVIAPSKANSVVANTMFYFRNSTTLQMTGMYGTPAREALGSTLNGSYNLFLGMENYLRVINTSSDNLVVTLNVTTASGTNAVSYSFPGNYTFDFPIHDATSYGTSADTYGFVSVETSDTQTVITELLRYRPFGSEADFVFPTEVRP